MIKNIAYFPLQAASNSKPVMSAVLSTLQQRGIELQENSQDSDAAIIWSVLWQGKMFKNKAVYEHYRLTGRPVIVIEVGALHRGHTWKVAVNHINASGYYGQYDNLDWDRPKKLGISLSTPVNPDPRIIVALQHSQSLQTAAVENMSDWLYNTISVLTTHTDRPITVRPHPRDRIVIPQLNPRVVVEQPQQIPGTYDSFDMTYNCHAMVNLNSGPGIQAAIAGVRPIVTTDSLAYPVRIEVSDIEKPYDVDRTAWLVQICHTEYTLEELQKGQWFDRIAPALGYVDV